MNTAVQNVSIIPVIIGTLGTIYHSFKKWIKMIDLSVTVKILQKAHLLKKVKVKVCIYIPPFLP